MHAKHICAVMVHVPSPAQGLAWYEKAFTNAIRQDIEGQDFEYLQVGDVRIEMVKADEKVTSGPVGTVVYWEVESISQALAHLLGLGGKLYRGPMTIEDKRSMCQVQDPWGNCIGLRGIEI
tara:strand:+ start:109032 stop:109394 length:363 start_codon:yes stop_codon:yes gene_type:complete